MCPYRTPKKTRYNMHCTSLRHQRNMEKIAKVDAFNAVYATPPSVVNIINGNITINNHTTNKIYVCNVHFNKDLEYYQELVNKMGKEAAQSYLMHIAPKTGPYGILERIYDTVERIPIRVDDDGFVIFRSSSSYDMDFTGDIIDKETREKLDNALIMACNETNDESFDLLKTRKIMCASRFDMKKDRKKFCSVQKQVVVPKELIYKQPVDIKLKVLPQA